MASKNGKNAQTKKNKKTAKSPAATGSSKQKGLSLGAKVVIVLFAVLMALSLMLPSLSAIFANNQSNDAAQSEQSGDSASQDSSDSGDATSDSDSTDSTDDKIAQVDEDYGEQVDKLLASYNEDPTNLATLLNLGKNYMTWGVYVRYYGTTDANTSHANELLKNAIKYYDEYLDVKDSNAVRVDRALCSYYQEDANTALTELEELTASAPDYGPAWANLGMLYEATGDTDAAKEAYAKAQQTDPDDEYGAKSYADQRLAAIESSESGSSASGAAGSTSSSTGGTSSTGTQGLSQTLGDLSGTAL